MDLDYRIKELDAIYNPFDLEKMNLFDYIGEKVYASSNLTSFSNLSNTVYGTLEKINITSNEPFEVDGGIYSFFIPESDLKEEVQWECYLAFQKTLNYSQYNTLKNDIEKFCKKLSKLMYAVTKATSFKIEFNAVQSMQTDQFGQNTCKAEFGIITITRVNRQDVKYNIYAYKVENGLYKYGVPYSNVGINPYANIVDALTDYIFKNDFKELMKRDLESEGI